MAPVAWAAAALGIDSGLGAAGWLLAFAFLLAVMVLVARAQRRAIRWLVCWAGFALVLAWWLTLKPTNFADWQPNVVRLARGELHDGSATLFNVRDCDYQTEQDYTCQWQTRTYDLSQLRGVDLFLTTWGTPLIAHPIVSFDFGPAGHLAFSAEARYKRGQDYSAILGFFRQFELALVAADERDIIRLRTNYRKNEMVRLYHTEASPRLSRELFLGYVARLNDLAEEPEWYNALTNNCTSNLYAARALRERPWDYRNLLNAGADRMEFERGDLASGGLSFPALRRQALINPAAQAADNRPDFSDRIRAGRAGFPPAS